MKETQDQRSCLTLAVKYSYLYQGVVVNHTKLKNKNTRRIFLQFSFRPPDGAYKFGTEDNYKFDEVGITSLRLAYISNKQTKKFTLYISPFIRFKASDKLFFYNLNERNRVGLKFLLNPKYVVL